MAIIFIVSSSGYLMYTTNCLCTGETHATLFVRPATCEQTFHKHHKHNEEHEELACTAHECHECVDHTKSCGCDSPQLIFLKLKDKAIDDEVNFVAVSTLEIAIVSSEILAELCIVNNDDSGDEFYTDPPPKIASSLDFLINIQQLKIPSLA